MATGGINFGSAKTLLATVTANGIDPSDPRVQSRTDEAQQRILNLILPVNGMMQVDIVASGTTLLLPKEMENAIEVQVLGASVRGSSDIAQGWFDIVNQFTYVDPEMAHDNPLIDQYLQPDPNDNTILRRQYDYPGLTPNATVRVTGAKKWLPIENDNTFLIVQNVPALKLMIQAIEADENNDHQGAEVFEKRCLETLQSEVKKHLLDPMNHMRRKSEYLNDLVNFPEYSFAWMRANLALEVPGALAKGKLDITFALSMAEKRLMQRGIWKDCIQDYDATVTGGLVAFPLQVQSVLAIDLCGNPIPIRSEFFEYLDNGPGMYSCHPMLVDQGDQMFSEGRRRVYKLKAPTDQNQDIKVVTKLRWIEKQPTDQMVIRNFNALRLMMAAIFSEEKEDWQGAMANEQLAVKELEKELQEYLGGIVHTPRVQTEGFGMGRVGSML